MEARSLLCLCGAILIFPLINACQSRNAFSESIEQSKSVPAPQEAKVINSILPGPIAEGAAPVPFAPVLSQSRSITVRLDVVHQVQEVADGVKMMVWTFGGQVPGPTVRVRQGDKVKFVMANRSSETAQVTPPMPHSMDFHSAMVNPQDKFRSIGPGQTIEFEFIAYYPGVYLYHCATPLMVEHLAHGMYGAMIVEPKEGYPTHVDREYVLVQSEFYPKLNGKKSKDGVTEIDSQAVAEKRPSIVAFNGRAFRHIQEPLKAKAGEKVRLFVLNAGPSNFSTFHVIGGVFDRTWIEGVPANELRGGQAVNLGPSNSAIVELLIPEPGKYDLVDHVFADARAGATGLIDASN